MALRCLEWVTNSQLQIIQRCSLARSLHSLKTPRSLGVTAQHLSACSVPLFSLIFAYPTRAHLRSKSRRPVDTSLACTMPDLPSLRYMDRQEWPSRSPVVSPFCILLFLRDFASLREALCSVVASATHSKQRGAITIDPLNVVTVSSN